MMCRGDHVTIFKYDATNATSATKRKKERSFNFFGYVVNDFGDVSFQ